MHTDRRSPCLVAACALALTLTATSALAGGLRCSVGEVVIENLAIGHTYSLTTLANLPLSITSTCDDHVRVAVEPLVPDAGELRPGVAAIPDRRWAIASPDTLELDPRQTHAVTMQLAIPNDPSLLGRRFQVTFWTHTLPKEGQLLAYGLKSRVIFSISPTADAADTPPTGDLSVSLLPADIHVASLPAGKSVRLETLTEPLTVTNTSAHRVSVELRALTCESAGSALHANEAEMLKAADVRIQPGTLTLEPGERRTVTGTITRGSAKASRGKDLVCVISAAVTGEPVQTRIYSRLYAPVR